MEYSKIRCSKNTTHVVGPHMCPRKTICRHEHTNMYKLSKLPVAFSTRSCHDYNVKAQNVCAKSIPKVKRSLTHTVLLYFIVLCSLLSVVIAVSDAQDSRDYSDRTGKTIDNIPHRTKAQSVRQPLKDNVNTENLEEEFSGRTLPRVRPHRRPLQIIDHPVADIHRREREYAYLYRSTADKDGLESIRALHRQLDDDNDGSIEPSETGDFIRGDLKKDVQGADRRAIKFHRKDSEITVNDLWDIWRKSEIHNWTVEQTIEWLSGSHVELPQYADQFRSHGVNGSRLPQVAISTGYLAKVVGITNAIHRSKITLKAMDVVLFGPPKSDSNPLKDLILTSLLVAAVTGLLYAYSQNRKSQLHLKKMMQDMEGLSKAEQSLLELQEKLHERDTELKKVTSPGITMNEYNPVEDSPLVESERMELDRVKQEVEALRNELDRAQFELEDKCWMAPPVLQHWLQLTYELECLTYNTKKREAEKQLETVKDMCEKLKKKQKSLMGAFVSTHGRSIDDVDRSILEARTALIEVTKDLSERSQRWRQIEILCGCSIVSNPGISALQNLVRTVGAGRLPNTVTPSLNGSNAGDSLIGGLRNRPISSRMSNRGSQDDLLQDDDAHSIAASSYMTSASQRRHVVGNEMIGSGAASVSGSTTMHHRTASSVVMSRPGGNKSVVSKQMSRESSKESGVSGSSGSSDDLRHLIPGNAGGGGSKSNPQQSHQRVSKSNNAYSNSYHRVSATPPPVNKLLTSSGGISGNFQKAPRIGPGGRRMVKSFSQDAASSMASAATIAMNTLSSAVTGSAVSVGNDCGHLLPVASDSRLEQKDQYSVEKSTNISQSQTISSDLASVSADKSVKEDENKVSLRLECDSTPLESNSDKNFETNCDERQEILNIVTIQTPQPSVEGVIGSPQDNSDSGSIISLTSSFNDVSSSANNSKTTDGDGTSVKSKKRRSFFNFRRSKKDHKKEVIL